MCRHKFWLCSSKNIVSCLFPWSPSDFHTSTRVLFNGYQSQKSDKNLLPLLHILTAKQRTGWTSAHHHQQFHMPYSKFSQSLTGVSELYCRFQKWALALQIITLISSPPSSFPPFSFSLSSSSSPSPPNCIPKMSLLMLSVTSSINRLLSSSLQFPLIL